MTMEQAAHRLEVLFSVPLQITWHENRVSFISCAKEQGKIRLRLHRLFAKAPSPVLEAICSYALTGNKEARALIRQMAHFHFSTNHSRPDCLESKGRHYDLHEIACQVQTRYTLLLPALSIGWSAQVRVGKLRSITFGTYDAHRNQVRIHPWLDDARVPRYFLEFLVYHEMLHAVCPSYLDARGRVCCHTPEFRRLERQFLEYKAAKEWEKKSLNYLASWRRGYGRS
ncbi:MAG: hypothetical protein HY861_00190 [Chlamydiia bacterium]|nr:hypothetical protein [Chlamydiia bacterium]